MKKLNLKLVLIISVIISACNGFNQVSNTKQEELETIQKMCDNNNNNYSIDEINTKISILDKKLLPIYNLSRNQEDYVIRLGLNDIKQNLNYDDSNDYEDDSDLFIRTDIKSYKENDDNTSISNQSTFGKKIYTGLCNFLKGIWIPFKQEICIPFKDKCIQIKHKLNLKSRYKKRNQIFQPQINETNMHEDIEEDDNYTNFNENVGKDGNFLCDPLPNNNEKQK